MVKKFKYNFGPGITKWVEKPCPKQSKISKSGWFAELDKVFVQIKAEYQYVVMMRHFEHENFGIVIHCCIRNGESSDISWNEKQRIKDEIFGPETNAIEFFPPQSKLIDEANMYHLWITPDFNFPFGLHSSQDNS